MPEEVGDGGETRRNLSSRKALGLVIRTLAELRETKGVSPHRVYRHVAAEEGGTRMTPGRLQLAMERGVRDGILVQHRGRYNLNLDLPVLDNAKGGCGCGSSSKRRRKKSSSSKRCRKRSSSSRRRRGRSSSSSRRRRRGRSSRRRKPLCGRSQLSLYKRLVRLMFPRKRSGKHKHKKRMPYTWVRQHCRRNPHHSRNRRRGRR